MLNGVIHTRISFFEANPIGRILNRFSGDVVVADERIPFLSFYTSTFTLLAIATVVFTCITNWLLIFLFLLFIIYAMYIIPLYLRSSLSLIRLERTTSSPIFELFTAIFCAEGLATIRLHAKQQHIMKQATDLIDVNFRMTVMFASAFGYMTVLLDMVNPIIIIVFPLITSSISANNISLLTVTFMYIVRASFDWKYLMFYFSQLVDAMTAVERIVEG